MFRQAPFLRLVLFFIGGILVQYQYDIANKNPYFVGISVCFLGLSFVPKIKRMYSLRFLFGWGILLLSFSLGVFLTDKAWIKSDWEIEEKHHYCVRLIDVPLRKPKTYQCKAEILSADSLVDKKVKKKKVLIYLPIDSFSERCEVGDYLQISAELKKPEAQIEGGFDYGSYLRKQSYSATGFVRKNDWKRLEANELVCGSPTKNLHIRLLKWRMVLLAHLKTIIPDEKSYSLAAALMFGYKNDLDKDLRQSFSHIGAGHVLAVSGLHFSIVFGMAYFFLSFLGMSSRAKITKQLILLPLIWGFALLTGFSASVIRAAFMQSIWGIGDAFNRRSFTLNTIAISAFFMLLFQPLFLFDIGFQLSFFAVTSIVVLNPLLVNLYQSRNPVLNCIWQLIAVSLTAQIGVLPLSIYYFHQMPVVFLLTNLLLIPLVGLLLFMILLSLGIFFLAGNVAWLLFPLSLLLGLFLKITEMLDAIPRAAIYGFDISLSETFMFYFSILIGVLLFMKKRVIYLYLCFLLVAIQLIFYLC